MTIEAGSELYYRLHPEARPPGESTAELARAVQRGVAAAHREGDPDEAEAARQDATKRAEEAERARLLREAQDGIRRGRELYDRMHPRRNSEGA